MLKQPHAGGKIDQNPQSWIVAARQAARSRVGTGTTPSFLPRLDESRGQDSVAMAYATVEGALYSSEDANETFSLQSITKLFALTLLLRLDGDRVWDLVAFAGTDQPYHSVLDIESGRAPNPFVNAGALVIADRLATLTGDVADAVASFISDLATGSRVQIDQEVATAELADCDRNISIVYALAARQLLTNPPSEVLKQYIRMCAITASCTDVARASTFLANRGETVAGGRVLSPRDTRRLNGLLSLAGMYDASAATMFTIGLPAKSGVGGGIVAVLDRHGAVCAASPGLDDHGTSVAAAAALTAFAEAADLAADALARTRLVPTRALFVASAVTPVSPAR